MRIQMGKFASSQNCRFSLTKLDKEGWILWRLGWALGEKQEKGLGQDSASVFNAASPGQVVEMYIRLMLCPGMERWWRHSCLVMYRGTCVCGSACVLQRERDVQRSWHLRAALCIKHHRFLVCLWRVSSFSSSISHRLCL
jgi:hypothetical protein